MAQEKHNQIVELTKRAKYIEENCPQSMHGQGDFTAANNPMRGAMNVKQLSQHLALEEPEFPYLYEGKENVMAEYSSFYERTKKEYKVVGVVKKYNELLKGKTNGALYFLYCKEDDSYKVIERKAVESLIENFGFSYKNETIDGLEVGEKIPAETLLYAPTSYDEYLNLSMGVNGRIIYAVHPAVQDDAIIVSKSFARRMRSPQITQKIIPLNENAILLNLYGKDGEYKGLPDIGMKIKSGILAATRNVKETRMFSDLRDSSLNIMNNQSDQIFYGDGEIIDIHVYVNNPNIKVNKVTKQLVEYYNDTKHFYSKVYRVCQRILNSKPAIVDKEINRWMKKAIDYLDTRAVWAWNDSIFSNMMIEILIRKIEPLKIGHKLVGRSGNKSVISSILGDEEMPFTCKEVWVDEYGVTHPKGEIQRVELIANPVSTINRTSPMIPIESSITFVAEAARDHMKTLDTIEEQKDFMFDIQGILNPGQAKALEKIYDELSEKEQKKFIKETLNTMVYIKWDAFNKTNTSRDALVNIYEKYSDIIKPQHVFVPKLNWGRDIYLGQHAIGYQYTMMLKQTGERGFSVRSAGAISDESLPEKSHQNKIGQFWSSETPIRFGEYETPNFMIVTHPKDYALFTALCRSSTDGRIWLSKAILDEDEKYNIPNTFTSRTSQILQVFLKNLGVKMETIIDESEWIGEPEHDVEVRQYRVKNNLIHCTANEKYYLDKLAKVYKRYQKEHKHTIDDMDELWEYIMDNLPFKKKELSDSVIKIFKDNLEAFA
jgi:hypothetical protein